MWSKQRTTAGDSSGSQKGPAGRWGRERRDCRSLELCILRSNPGRVRVERGNLLLVHFSWADLLFMIAQKGSYIEFDVENDLHGQEKWRGKNRKVTERERESMKEQR